MDRTAGPVLARKGDSDVMATMTPTASRRAFTLRTAPHTVAVLMVSGLLLTGCTTDGKSHTPPAPAEQHTSAAQDSGVSKAGRIAEAVQQTLAPWLNGNEDRFGSGTNSPCSTSHASMFTSACQSVADAAGQDAARALAAISGKSGFATLRSVATRLQQAVDKYTTLRCAHAPSDTSVRHQCLDPAAQIAQAESDLRGGVNMGLAGQ